MVNWQKETAEEEWEYIKEKLFPEGCNATMDVVIQAKLTMANSDAEKRHILIQFLRATEQIINDHEKLVQD